MEVGALRQTAPCTALSIISHQRSWKIEAQWGVQYEQQIYKKTWCEKRTPHKGLRGPVKGMVQHFKAKVPKLHDTPIYQRRSWAVRYILLLCTKLAKILIPSLKFKDKQPSEMVN